MKGEKGDVMKNVYAFPPISWFSGTLAANQDDTCFVSNTIRELSTELVDSGQDLGNLAQTYFCWKLLF